MMKTTSFARRTSAAFALLFVALAVTAIFAMRYSEKTAQAEQTVASASAVVSARDGANGSDGDLTYEVTDFSTVAVGDWTVSQASDAQNSSVKIENGELNVNAANAVEQKYYGALLPINPGASYTKFTFELTFRVNGSNGDLNRWLGIVYRTRYASEAAPVTGYVMNYRINGKNAYSAINKDKSFRDIGIIDAGGALADGMTAPAVLDGAYHTITITMDGDVAKHYIDGHLVREAYTSDQTNHLGGIHDDGGFALIVNCMRLSIKRCRITPDEIITPKITEYDNTIVTTYRNGNVKIANAPTVVCDVKDEKTLQSLTNDKKPSNAILRFDKDGNVTAENGEILGGFAEIYASLEHKIIPVAFVADDDAANALIKYLTEENGILDMAVMSDKPELVKKVRSAYPKIRGVIEYSHADMYTDGKLDLFDNIVGRTNANYAMTAVLPQSAATRENVEYVQARFKTVWVRPQSDNSADIKHAVNSGAFGIVSENFAAVYGVLESYPENSYTRTPYNVAHRGLYENSARGPYENSLKAVKNAISGGATHLELDGHMTSDGHIVIMHDTSIDRTTTGSGEISQMTLEQIKRHTLLDGQEIPTLEQVLEILYSAKLDGKDIVFVFELKAGATIAQKIDSLLGSGDGQFDVRDNLVVITFNNSGDDLLTSIKTAMPTTPTAHLISASEASLAGDLMDMGMYNCCYDMIYTEHTTPDYDKYCLTDRGISGWYWTFGTAADVIAAAKKGHIGLTNNAPLALTSYYRKIENINVGTRSSVSIGDEIPVKAYRYGGLTAMPRGKICHVEQTDTGWNAIACLTDFDMTLYTQVFHIPRTPAPPVEPQEQTVRIIAEGKELTSILEADGGLRFTPPEIYGKTYVGLFADPEFTLPATAADIKDGGTLYAKYENTPRDDEIDTPEPDDTVSGDEPRSNGVDALAVGLPLGLFGAAALGAGIYFAVRKKRKNKRDPR